MTLLDLHDLLEHNPIGATAPGRIDMGGTLDIKTLHLLLREQQPCTFNMALQLRTRVDLHPYSTGRIKIVSQGFEDAVFTPGTTPLTHPLGLMFAVATFFGVSGIEIRMASDLPPSSGLGGSSAAAVALIGALNQVLARLGRPRLVNHQIVELAHALEEAVAGHLCGKQDQLAAVYGGMHLWQWSNPDFLPEAGAAQAFSDDLRDDVANHAVLAYTGEPHTSYDINRRWIQQFAAGDYRAHWHAIVESVTVFAQALQQRDYVAAGAMLNRETRLRCEMTPEVLNPVGQALAAAARENGGGARFTGAGGGGCLWALGATMAIERIRAAWQILLADYPQAVLLPVAADASGLVVTA